MKKLISIIIPIFNEELNIGELSKRLGAIKKRLIDYDFEIIMVENGSTDDSYNRLLKLHKVNKCFKILQLSRNYRMDGALTAGMNYANGDCAVLMAGDLQDPPELIPLFVEKWESGFENVYMIVKQRKGVGFLRRLNSQIFYFIASRLTNKVITPNVSDFRLIDKKVYQAINTMHERNRFVRGLISWSGFKSVGIIYDRAERFAGSSSAHFFKVLSLAIKGILSHSQIPLRFISLFGLFLFTSMLVISSLLIIKFIFFGVPFDGFGTLILIILMLFSVLFFILGILAEYLALMYEEIKARPNYIVSKKHGIK
jgi:dolichol-phosphate mannosyltransferase